jgi:hypothetical protein
VRLAVAINTVRKAGWIIATINGPIARAGA